MTDLRPLMIMECPPKGGCGPLGALDGDAGLRLARLDPANAVDLDGKATEPARTRRCLERTLSLFERENLCAAVGGWDLGLARELWRLGYVRRAAAGRRMVIVGRVRDAAGLRGLPPLRWLRMGGVGEPAEVCYLPDPVRQVKWYNVRTNHEAAARWLAAERARLSAAERSWSTFGDEPDRGCFAFRAADCSLQWLPHAGAAWDDGRDVVRGAGIGDPAGHERVLRALAVGLTRIPRWSGASDCSVAAHSLRVALVADLLRPGARRRGACHDASEALPGVGDQPTPEKRWMRLVSPEFDALHRGADDLVLGLCGCADDPPDVVEAVHLADRVAMATERAVYFGDAPAWLADVRLVAQAILADSGLALRIRSLDQALTQYDPQYNNTTPYAATMIDAMRGDFEWACSSEPLAIGTRLAELARGCA